MLNVLDLKKISLFLGRQIVALVVVLIFFSFVSYRLWDIHMVQEAEAVRLYKEAVRVNDLKVDVEKDASNIRIEQEKRSLALEKKEFLVEQAERNIASSTADLTRREQVLAESYAKLVAERATLESERAVASEDARIQMLISEFSALGVNLNDNHHCLSGDALIRYNAAFSKFSAITALVRASSLANKYAVFISQNQRNTLWYSC